MAASRAMVKTSSTIGGTLVFLSNLASKVHVAHEQE